MRKFDYGDALRPEEEEERDDPQPNGHSAVGGNGRNHIEVEDRHDKQQHEIAAPESTNQMGLSGGLWCRGHDGLRVVVGQLPASSAVTNGGLRTCAI